MVSVACAVDGCDKGKSKRQWCDRHYQTWRRHGDPLGSGYTWHARAEACVACGKPEIAPNMRRYCSEACRQSAYRAQAAARNEQAAKTEPATSCISCGAPLLTGRVNGRALHKRTRRYCAECKGKPRRSYRLAVYILAHYQGNDCGICSEPIDMDVRFPDKRCASIDHITPLSFGGTDDVSNLRLAHYDCNCRREDYWRLTAKETS